jgi:hypothetical protein
VDGVSANNFPMVNMGVIIFRSMSFGLSLSTKGFLGDLACQGSALICFERRAVNKVNKTKLD